jgi:DNA-binding transcriptional MocR family regulator
MSFVTSPLTAAIATNWIHNGTADAVLAAIRIEAAARREIAKAVFPPGTFVANQEGYHLWLSLPSPWTRSDFTTRLRSVGIGVVSSDAFALGIAPEAVRLSLGVPPTKADLRTSLQTISNLIVGQPAISSMVV